MIGSSEKNKGIYWIIIGLMMSWTGIAGIVDGFIEWRDFFANFISHYVYFRNFLLSWVPFHIPSFLADYLVIGSGITLIVRVVAAKIKQNLGTEDEEYLRTMESINAYKQREGRIKYYFNVMSVFLRGIWKNGFWGFINKIAQSKRDINFGDIYLAAILYAPYINLLIWPYTVLTYREHFKAFYRQEKLFAMHTFLYFWAGVLVFLFLLVDYKKSFPDHFG